MKLSAPKILNDVLVMAFIFLVGMFAVSAFVKQPKEFEAQEAICTVQLTDTEVRIFQVAADLDTIGFRIDSIMAKLDSLEERED